MLQPTQTHQRTNGLLVLSTQGMPIYSFAVLFVMISYIMQSPYLGSAFLGCWLTDPLNNYLGRRGTLFFCGIFCIVSVIGSGLCKTWPQLLVSILPFVSFVDAEGEEGLSATSRSWNGPQSIHLSCFCCRKYASKHPWRSRHVMADVGQYDAITLAMNLVAHISSSDRLRHPSRVFRQPRPPRCWCYRVAS
jgi:hypothetical protein